MEEILERGGVNAKLLRSFHLNKLFGEPRLMTTMMNALSRLVRDEEGSQATEIALGIVLIALVAGIGMVVFGDALASFFIKMGGSLDAASPGAIPTPEHTPA